MGGQQDMFENPWMRARELKAKQRYREAAELLTRALAQQPSDLRLKASLADLRYRTRRYREAMALAGEILREDPDDPRALTVMGNVLLARRKAGEAVACFRLAQRVAETDYLWARLARCHLDLKQLEEALQAIERGLALSPQDPELLRLREEATGASQRKKGNRKGET